MNYLLIVLFLTSSIFCKTHVIKFRSNDDVFYAPKILKAQIGDTVLWEGKFSSYPLHSTTVPRGADSWQTDTGKIFQYIVNVPGTYNYICYPTAQGKRICTFEVVRNANPLPKTMLPTLKLNGLTQDSGKFIDKQSLSYSISVAQTIKFALLSEEGKEVAILDEGLKPVGEYRAAIQLRNLTPGFYVARLSGAGEEETIKLHLEKKWVKVEEKKPNPIFHIEE